MPLWQLFTPENACTVEGTIRIFGPPPPESAVERRWFEENRSSSYSAEDLIVATA